MQLSVYLLPLLLLQLQLSVLLVNGQCSINRQMVRGTNKVFLVRGNNQRTFLKRTERVQRNEVLQMYCSATSQVATRCEANGRFNPALPQTCTGAAPQARVEEIQGQGCRGTLYRIGHSIGNQFHELYRACFNQRVKAAVYIDHRVYAKTFIPERVCNTFTRDNVITGAVEASYVRRNIFRTFRRIYGNNNRYVRNDRDVIINRGHLAASADFLFNDQQCATFKYVNVVPQFRSINDRNWESIERWVRGRVTGNQYVRVRTGATGVLQLPDARNRPRAAFLSGNQNPVPEWMYKVVRSANGQPLAIFVTYNNIFARARPRPPRYCRSVRCPTTIRLVPSARAGYTYCCDAARFNP